MKASIAAIIAIFITLVHSQVTFSNNTFQCLGASENKAFCAGDSLQTNIIIRCVGTVGQPGNCNDNLAGIPPVGVKVFAPCFQSSPTAGDAACSFDGVAYPDNGSPFNISSGLSNSSSIAVIPTTTTTSLVLSTAVTTATGSGSPVYGGGNATTTVTKASPPAATFTGGAAGGIAGGVISALVLAVAAAVL
ncbi:hypothetical protein MMC06_003798 [Schaereria dolodes]|nr:hypothetical protein [Schaereria dolodes]